MTGDSPRSLRVLMLNNEFPPLGGGTGTVNRILLQHFSRVPWMEIDLVTSALGREYEEEQLAERIRIYKVPVGNRNIHHSSNRELLTYAWRALLRARTEQQAQDYDVCFAWSAVPAGGVALALRRLTGLRYLVRVSGPDIPGFERRYRWLYPLLTPVVRAVWHGADTVIAKCVGEAEMIRAVDGTVHVTLVPNGVDTTFFQPGDHRSDNGPLRILCVGRLVARKGQHHLIEAVKRLADTGMDVRLELVGTGDAVGQYRKLAARLGVEGRVEFAGYVPREAMPARYASAHVFALPSYNEGMSVATLEAMAAGLPLVVTRTGGTTELVEHGVNGLTLEWADVEMLVSHIRCLANDRALAQSMGSRSRERAASMTWDDAADRYLELFRCTRQHAAAPCVSQPAGRR